MSETPLTADELRRLRDLLRRVPYAKLIGIELDGATRGTVTMHMDVREDLKQVSGVLHGGSIASLIDTAAAFAVITLLEPEQRATTSDLTIHYLRPIDSGPITAEARVLRSGKRLSVVAVDVFSGPRSLSVTAVTTYIRLL